VKKVYHLASIERSSRESVEKPKREAEVLFTKIKESEKEFSGKKSSP